MTHYDGKSSYFHERKSVINREPLYVNKKIYQESIENLYKVHRDRVINASPLTHTTLKTYEFLENQSWKKQTQQVKALELLKTNELIYSRINKVETTDSRLLCEQRDHLRKISVGTHHMRRLKEIARQRSVDKVQRENIFLKERLEKIKPYYSKKMFDDSYEHHKTFLRGRRTDNTAGHIIKCPKKLQAGPLPPVHSSLAAGSTLPNKSYPSLERLSPIPNGQHRSQSASALDCNSSVISSSDSVSLLEVPSKLRSTLSSKTYPLTNSSSLLNDGSSGDEPHYSMDGELLIPYHDPSGGLNGDGLTDEQLLAGESDGNGNGDEDDDIFSAEPRESPRDHNTSKGNSEHTNTGQPSLRPSLTKSRSIVISAEDNDELASNHYLLSSRPISVLGDVTNCLLRVYTTKIYDENLLIRAMSLVEPTKVFCERYITIDQAYDFIHLSNVKPSTTEDLQSLRAMLVTMFQEVDTESNGYLTYDEFQLLMERIEVGITAQELRFVIAEADENENGYIDYHEFVPLAVDMIQAFRARSRAITSQELIDNAIEDDILLKVNREEVQRITNIFFDHVKHYDTSAVRQGQGQGQGQGKAYALRPSELRKCLKSIATLTSLSNSEINMIAQSLPKDAFGRLIYKDFRNCLYKVKMAAMRNMIIESQGNDIQQYLMQLCRDEEITFIRRELEYGSGYGNGIGNVALTSSPTGGPLGGYTGGGYTGGSYTGTGNLIDRDDIESGLTGWLPLRSLINLMISSPRLSLTRLQVMVIASEAEVTEGRVNYLHFIPIASKTIELMFEPKTLRQRAELIETSDLSPQVLLNGENPTVFVTRLKSLFKSYDLERKGELNAKQFRAMLESMDLQLTSSEILSLMAIADYNNNGFISFDEFCEFCFNNLLHLEREKHIRMLQKAIHGTVEETSGPRRGSTIGGGSGGGGGGAGGGGGGTRRSSAGRAGGEEEGGGGEKGGEGIDENDLQTIQNIKNLEIHLRQIFQLADQDHNGYLNQEELESLFLSLDIQLTPFQLMVLLSECDANNNGLVEYEEFIPICVDILEAAKAKNSAMEMKLQREAEAKEKVLGVYPSWEGDVKISTDCLYRVLNMIEMVSGGDAREQKNLLISAAKNPLNGLSRTEANIFIAEILRNKRGTGGGGGGGAERDIIRDLMDKTTATDAATATAAAKPLALASPTAGASSVNFSGLTSVTSKYNKSYQEVFEIIKSIRLSTLMRGLLEGIHQTALAKHLICRFAEEAETLRKERKATAVTATGGGGGVGGGGVGGGGGGGALTGEALEGSLFYLPVKNIVKVLETTTSLRLHMAQILTLISWADSFQSPGLGIDYRDFAYYAADVIAKMYDTNELQKRSNVLLVASAAAAGGGSGGGGGNGNTVIDDNTALRGSSKESIELYLREEFQKVSSPSGGGGGGGGGRGGEGLVSAQTFFEVIRSIPRLQLTDRETSAVVASLTMTQPEQSTIPNGSGGEDVCGGGAVSTGGEVCGMYHWESYLPWAYGSIRAVCMERMIGRRVALMGVQSSLEEDHLELMKLGDRLIDISLVRKIGGHYSIAFVSETSTKNPRRSSLLPVKKKTDMPGVGAGAGGAGDVLGQSGAAQSASSSSATASGAGNRAPQEVFDILRTSVLVPYRLTKKDTPPKELLTQHPHGLHLLIRIAENDPVLCYDQPPLVIKAISRDAEYSYSLSLNLRLPSLGLVDQEAAEQFAANLTSRLYLRYDKSDPKLPNGLQLMIDM